MKKTIFILVVGFYLQSFAQTTFKKGYFINLEGEKKEVYIKAFGAEKPSKIYYQENLNSNKVLEKSTNEILEINVYDIIKFIKKEVSIEFLEKGMKAKTKNNSEIFKTENKNLVLKVLIETEDFSLLSYLDEETNDRYFFIESKNQVNLLEYKVIKENTKSKKIKNFRKFIFQNYKIENSKLNVGKLNYDSNDFKKYFRQYINSLNKNLQQYSSFERDFKDAFNITPTIGYSFLNQDNINETSSFNSTFKTNHINIGLDIEYLLNNLEKKSAFVFSINYLINSDNEEDYSFGQGNPNNSTIVNELSLITLDLKYRYYITLKQNNTFFLNAGIGGHFSSGKTTYTFNPTNAFIADLKYNNVNPIHFSLGAGYNFKKYYLQASYIPKFKGDFDSLTSEATNGKWNYERSLFNISLGYSIF